MLEIQQVKRANGRSELQLHLIQQWHCALSRAGCPVVVAVMPECAEMQRVVAWNPPMPLNHANKFHSWDCVCSVQFAFLSFLFPLLLNDGEGTRVLLYLFKFIERRTGTVDETSFWWDTFLGKGQAVQQLSCRLLLKIPFECLLPVRRRKEGVQKKQRQKNGIWEENLEAQEVCLEIFSFTSLPPALSFSVPGSPYHVPCL